MSRIDVNNSLFHAVERFDSYYDDLYILKSIFEKGYIMNIETLTKNSSPQFVDSVRYMKNGGWNDDKHISISCHKNNK